MIALSQCPGIDQSGKDCRDAVLAALNQKVPLTWDCPVTCTMGTDPAKSIFVPDMSDVTFTKRGQLTIDNAGFPGLCFYHAHGTWRGARIRYTGGLSTTLSNAPNRWTDVVAKNYLLKSALNTFASGYNSFWTGPTNTSALISVRGASNVTFQGLDVSVPADVPASSFVPVVMALDNGFVPGALVNAGTLLASPSVTVTDFSMDGAIMGVVGGGKRTVFERVVRRRYSDLQDADGSNIGGVGTWFAPPHAFYLQGSLANPMTAILKDVVDLGEYVGNPVARKSTSGSVLSLKIELANGSLVDGYTSRCRHGAMDILSNGAATGGSITNAFFIIDTSIMTVDGKPAAWGIRFPSSHAYPPSIIHSGIANLANVPVPVHTAPSGVTLQLNLQQGY